MIIKLDDIPVETMQNEKQKKDKTITTKTKQEGKENYQYVGPLQWLITCELEISRKKDKEAEIKIFKEMIEIFSNLKICIFRVVNEASRTKNKMKQRQNQKTMKKTTLKHIIVKFSKL